jgi:hypothetical protein
MKKFSIIFLLLLNTYSFSQSYPHITELRGLEDSLGNTHLFYRIVSPYSGCWSKNIYHLDLLTNADTLFISDQGIQVIPEWGCQGDYVNEYEFFNNDPAKFIYCGYNLNIDPVALLRRYDGDIQLEAFALDEIEISKQNENLVYISAGSGFFKSTDGGYNFERKDTMQFIDESIISLSKNNGTQIYGIDDSKLVRSENDGLNYIIVDNSLWRNDSELFYDIDHSHIYGRSVSYNFSSHTYSSKIYMSNDNGNPFTWNTIIEYDGKAWFTIDQNQSGEIYYSAGSRIFKSTDFGSTFLLYKQLDRNITGLYKKSGTNILYASTPLRIYEITVDTIQVVKNLSVPETAFKFYPLEIGNRWVYDKYTYIEWNTYHDIYIREVTGDTVLSNGKKYNKIEEYDFGQPYINFSFERMDSSEGMIYRYDNTLGLPEDEYLIDDLLASIGDTIQSFRIGYPWVDGFTILLEESIFAKWGLSKPKKIFEQYDLMMPRYSLVQDIGLDSLTYSFDFGYAEAYLKGCVINDVLFGDTTVVSVEDGEIPVSTSFKLEQNYPNPFNPSTKIKFTIPSVIASETKQSHLVTLKVYDVLGNEIATLVNEEKPAGEYEVEFGPGSSIKQPASGIYFYQLKSGSFVETKKMVLLK